MCSVQKSSLLKVQCAVALEIKSLYRRSTNMNSKFLAQFDHLVRRQRCNLRMFLVEVLCEVGVLNLRVVHRRQRVDYLYSHKIVKIQHKQIEYMKLKNTSN